MTTTPTSEAILTRDPVKKDYVVRVPAVVELRLDAELYQRRWWKLATERNIDLSDPEALARHSQSVGQAHLWWDEPIVTKTILPAFVLPPPPSLSPEPELRKVLPKQEVGGSTIKQQRIDRLSLAAQTVSPSRWMDECRTPVPPEDVQGDPRRKVLRERTEEKYVLEWLYSEWKEGRFQISATAEQEEFPSQERLELMQAMTNATRLDNGFRAREEVVV